MKLKEIFKSIQGEGFFAGTPATFIRFYGCSVGCSWCDTKDSWGGPFIEEGQACIAERIERHPRLVVVTGGEPGDQDPTEMRELVGALLDRDHAVALETSGTKPWILDLPWTWITISPKGYLSGSLLGRANEVKWVVGTREELNRALEGLGRTRGRNSLQPKSGDPEATQLCIQACLEHDLPLSVQLHKILGVR